MPIIVNSPYSGRPVKVRDQDLGRAVRDEEGRIFYAVPRSGGKGYYGAPTRHGSPKDEQRYLEMESKEAVAADARVQARSIAVHDATGRPRGGLRRVVLLVILLAVLATLGYVAWLVLGEGWVGGDGTIDLPISPPQWPEQPPIPDTAPQLPAPAPPEPRAAMTLLIPSMWAGRRHAEAAEPVSVSAPQTQRLKPRRPEKPAPVPRVTTASDPASTPTATPTPGYVTTPSGLKYRILEPGRGRAATAGAYVLIHYTARLSPGGAVMDTSHTDDPATDTPIGFVLWSGRVIRGWDIGIAGMKIGETRELLVPAHLMSTQETPDADGAYLVFEIELVDVLPGVLTQTTRAGTVGGAVAGAGDLVEVRYVGYVDGEAEPFDDSRSRSDPLRFRLGAGEVIRGWDLGVLGMKEGEKRTLVIPPYLAYGQRGIEGLIPPGATLRYHIELLRVNP